MSEGTIIDHQHKEKSSPAEELDDAMGETASSLLEAVEALSVATDLQSITAAVCDASRQLSDADGVCVVLKEGDACHYVEENAVSPLWKGQRVPLESCISGWAMQHGETAIIPNISEDERIPDDAYNSTFVKSMVMVPVGIHDAQAALGVYWAKKHKPPDYIVNSLQALARIFSSALERVRDHEAERDARKIAETLNDLSRTVTSELDLDVIVQKVTDAGTSLSGARFGAFFYNSIDEKGENYLLYTLSGAPRSAFEKFGSPRNTAIFAPTFAGEGVVRLEDVLKDERYGKNPPHNGMPKGHLPVRSYLAVPVISRSGEVIGGLFFGHPEPGVFTERAEQLVTGVASHAAVAIDNARLYQSVQRELKQRERREMALASEARVLELAAKGASLSAIMDTLVRRIEALSEDDMICTILLIDESGERLVSGAAPSLDSAYNDAIDGIKIGPDVGSCGTAAYTLKPVFVNDIASDPKWAAFKELAADHNLAACHSEPFFDSQGNLLGTIAIYYRESRASSERDSRLVRLAAQLASIVIERDRIESALSQSEQRFRALIDASSQIVWTTGPDGRVAEDSPQWRTFTGQTWDEFQGAGGADAIHPDDRNRVRKLWKQSVRSKEPLETELRLKHVSGEWRWTAVRAVPLFDSHGEVREWVGMNIDISSRKAAEEAQKLLLGELNHRVKNTLANVQAVAQQTLTQSTCPTEFVESFTGRLQSFARLHQQLSHANWQGTELAALIRDQVLHATPKDVRLQMNGPELTLDPQAAQPLALIFHELGTNSRKYGALGLSSGKLDVQWAVKGRTLDLTWKETGRSKETSETQKGGFGTRLINKAASALGGSAKMATKKDGVEWSISLPLPEAAQPPSQPDGEHEEDDQLAQKSGDSKPAVSALEGKRILIVEDEVFLSMDLVQQVEETNAVAIGPASNVDRALKLIENETINLVLLDANLSGSPVTPIAEELERRNIPFIFVTGYGRESLPRAFVDKPLLAKPFSPEQLRKNMLALLADTA